MTPFWRHAVSIGEVATVIPSLATPRPGAVPGLASSSRSSVRLAPTRLAPTDKELERTTAATWRQPTEVRSISSENCYVMFVELRGIEPLTSCMPCKRSPI